MTASERPPRPNVLVAGATGFVGRALVPALIDRGHRFSHDLLPEDEHYWELTGRRPRVSFDAAARAALEQTSRRGQSRGLGTLEEALVRRVGPRLRPV